MPQQTTKAPVDHLRATAERNAAAILDATERLLAARTALSMVAIAAEAGVSRPTLYAHYKTIGEIVEAAVERSVALSVAAFKAAHPESGAADQALARMVEASWRQLGAFDALARGAAEHLGPGAVHRTHELLMRPLHDLVERGRREGVFRTDLPADWLVSMYLALMHGAYEHATATGMRAEALGLLQTTIRDLYAAR